jgi:heat shock protein HslJ
VNRLPGLRFGALAALLAVLALVVAGCSSSDSSGKSVPASPGRDTITGQWTAISYSTGTAVPTVIAGSPLTARFDRGQVTGDSGCNNFSGPYEATDTSIAMGPFSSTLMACVDPARQTQEQQYLAALELAATYRVTGRRLELRRRGGGIAATFEKSAATG